MNARSLDPIADYESHAERLERRHNGEWILFINDLLDQRIVVDGVAYDLKVSYTFSRQGESGPIKIEDAEFSGDLYIELPNHLDIVKLDLPHYRAHHRIQFERLMNHIDLLAMKTARESDKWELQDDE